MATTCSKKSDAVMPEVMDTSDSPASLPSLCTRANLLDPPDWRYRGALQYLADERAGESPTAPTDAVVQYAVRALRAFGGTGRSDAYARRYMQGLWPVMSTVLYYGVVARHSTVSADMDTCLIKGWTHAQARMAGCPFEQPEYDLYAKLFFDLSGIRAVHSWINDHIFEPERHAQNSTLLRSRILAYNGQGQTGMGIAVIGAMPGDSDEVIRSIMSNERQKRLFDYVLKSTRLPAELYAGIMEAALKSMTEHDFQTRMAERADPGSGSLEELALNLEEGIRAYSRQELQEYDELGLDFVNQYTKTFNKDGTNEQEDIK